MDLEAELTITNKLYIGEAFDRFMQTLLEVEYRKNIKAVAQRYQLHPNIETACTFIQRIDAAIQYGYTEENWLSRDEDKTIARNLDPQTVKQLFSERRQYLKTQPEREQTFPSEYILGIRKKFIVQGREYLAADECRVFRSMPITCSTRQSS